MNLAARAGIARRKAVSALYAAWVRYADAVRYQDDRRYLHRFQVTGAFTRGHDGNVSALFAKTVRAGDAC